MFTEEEHQLHYVLLEQNYDDLMEQALDGAGEPYHLFFYRAGEPL